MRGERALKAMFSDPRMKELIDSLWREYPGLYNERYNNNPAGSVPELVDGVEPWKPNIISPDIGFGQAMGQDHSINSNQSIAIGIGAITRAFREMIFGSYSTECSVANPTEWDELDRFITIGNGINEDNRSDALILFKSGLLELLNALKIGKYEHRTSLGELVEPDDGIIQFLEKKLELSFDGQWHELALKSDLKDSSCTVTQNNHGFSVGNTIKPSGSGWLKTQANNALNAATIALVSQVIDANNFKYITGGILEGNYTVGAEYFLSTTDPGGLIILDDPEVWEVGNIREYIGTGVEGGLMVEIDLGDEMYDSLINIFMAYSSDSEGTNYSLAENPALGWRAILITGKSRSELTATDFAGKWFEWLGADGKSAYQLALDNGFVGTEIEWIASLNGKDGKNTADLPITVQALSGTTPVWNGSLGVNATLTLTGNTTITLTNLVSGASGNLTITNASSVYTLTFAGYTNKISPSVYSATNMVKVSGLAKTDMFSWYYDGIRLIWNGGPDYK